MNTDTCLLRTEGSGENCVPDHDCAVCSHYEPGGPLVNDLDRLTELGRPTEKTQAYAVRLPAPVCTPSGESHAMVSKVLADAALAERTASDIEGWERVKELKEAARRGSCDMSDGCPPDHGGLYPDAKFCDGCTLGPLLARLTKETKP